MKGRIFSNLAISLDGKIADRTQPQKPFGTPLDRRQMRVIRRQADVVVVGAKTLAAHTRPMDVPGARHQPANAVITASGKLDPDLSFWQSPSTIRFVFTTQRGLAAAQRAARDRAFVVAVGETEVDLRQVVARLRESGLQNILVEGGGELMAAFLEASLLDELYVTLCPWLIGGRENPSLVGGPGLTAWTGLRLRQSKKVGDEIYFHYLVKKTKKRKK